MSTLFKLLCNPAVPRAFRLHLADRLEAGFISNGQEIAAEVLGWNAAMRSMGSGDLVPDLDLPVVIRRHVRSCVKLTPSGQHIRDEAQILHPKWRDAIERGEHIPDDDGELFTAGLVSERFVPMKIWEPVLGDAQVGDHSDGVHAPHNEVDVIQVESSTHDASHSTPAADPASNPFPNSTQPCCPAGTEVAK